MKKAIFIDYTGTILQNGGEDIEKMISRTVANSKAPDAGTLIAWYRQKLSEMEFEAYGDNYISQDEICLKMLRKMEHDWNLRDNLNELQTCMMNYWMHAPLFSDVVEFFNDCPVPIYIVSNISAKYIRICLKRNALHVHNIITGEMANAYGPHEELFRQALEMSETEPQDVIYIGELQANTDAAAAIGITSILLDRSRTAGEVPYRTVRKLLEVLRYI